MRVQTARVLAKATRLSWRVQRQLWDTGDTLTRVALAQQADLDPDIEDLIITQGDENQWASWARVTRPVDKVERVAQAATGDHAKLALASQPILSEAAITALATEPSPVLAARLLERSDIDERTRASLARIQVRAAGNSHGYAPNGALAQALGDSPLAWAAAIREAIPMNTHAILWRALPDHPLVHDALIESVELIPAGYIVGKVHRDLETALKWLLASPRLSLADAARVERLTAHGLPSLVERASRRLQCDVARLLETATCPPAGRGICTEASHVADMAALLSAHSDVRLPPVLAASEALAHRDVLPESTVTNVLRGVTGNDAGALLSTIEYSAGSHSTTIAFAVRHVGLWPASALLDPSPAIVLLSNEGWEPLLLPSNLPGDFVETVATRFAPVHRVLAEPKYANVVVETVEAMPLDLADTVWALLDEWSGDLQSLIRTAQELVRDS